MARFRCWTLVLLLACSAPGKTEVLVAMYDGTDGSVAAYRGDANGDVPPLRRIVGASTQFNSVGRIAVDAFHDEIVVPHANPSLVTVHALEADGDVAPLRTLEGGLTRLLVPFAVAVDTVHDELYVSNGFGPNHILVFSRTASGNTAPLRTLTVASSEPQFPRAIDYDPVRGELYVAVSDFAAGTSVLVYDRLAAGTAPPARRIAGAATGLTYANGLAFDSVHGELFVLENKASTGSFAVYTFDRADNGDVAPLRTISGMTAFGPFGPELVAYDPGRDELVVAGNQSLRIFPRTATGNLPPLRTIEGASTMINGVGGIAIGPDRIFRNGFEGAVTVALNVTAR